MKKKELKELANRIAKFEKICSDSSSNDKDVKNAKNQILELCSHVQKEEDIFMLDELIQDILKGES